MSVVVVCSWLKIHFRRFPHPIPPRYHPALSPRSATFQFVTGVVCRKAAAIRIFPAVNHAQKKKKKKKNPCHCVCVDPTTKLAIPRFS
ncbi:hypothetical protein ACKS0A_09584 [Histoplasma ohiense]